MNTMRRLSINNNARRQTFESVQRTATFMSEYTHIIYIKYASGWEKNIAFVVEEQIEIKVKELIEKGYYRVYVRKMDDPMRETAKVYTK